MYIHYKFVYFSGDWSLLSLSTKAIGHDKLRGCDYISRNLRTSQTTKIRLQLHFGEFHESDKPTNEFTHFRTGKYLNKIIKQECKGTFLFGIVNE